MLSLLVMFSTSRAQGNFTDIGTTAAADMAERYNNPARQPMPIL